MTRFARAKGSKSSNEKAPEDSTPWEVMKEQLLQAKTENDEAKKRQQAENQRLENYENFLKERKVQKRKATWCDFPETEQDSNKQRIVESTSGEPVKKQNKKTKKKNVNDDFNSNNINLSNETSNNVTSINSENKSKKRKNNNKPLAAPEQEAELNPTNTLTEVSETQVKKKKKNKNKVKTNLNREKNDNLKPDVNSNRESKNTSFSNKQIKGAANQNKDNNSMTKRKEKKLIDGKPARRKTINDNSFQLIINGKEVELVRFDGFPIMKKDAERLTELKDSMIKKGIPKSEVQRTMKLERRRAEKALARLKREVCYNCRKGGHNLSDCPELKSKIPGADAAAGVCFKCGSTEHRQFECKVQRDKEFRFATCFICKEPGHIARQCPDNPKGLYPNGGSCKLCGDVTHLRKDCPTANDKKVESAVKLQTWESTDNIEDIGQAKTVASSERLSKQPKKIKF